MNFGLSEETDTGSEQPGILAQAFKLLKSFTVERGVPLAQPIRGSITHLVAFKTEHCVADDPSLSVMEEERMSRPPA